MCLNADNTLTLPLIRGSIIPRKEVRSGAEMDNQAIGAVESENVVARNRKERSREVADLVALYKAGGDRAKSARDALILKMYPMLKSMSRRLTVEADGQIEREDLVQEGVVGLIHALERFDEDLGYQFSTYAYPTVLDYMRKLLRKSRTVRLPENLAKQTGKLRALEARLMARLGRKPAIQEIADSAGISIGEAATVLNTHTISSEVRVHVGAGQETLSLFDRLASQSSDSIDREVERMRIHRSFEAMLRFISPVQAKVLRRHFGVGGRPESYAEIARDLGITRQAVQKAASDGLKRIRHGLSRSDALDDLH